MIHIKHLVVHYDHCYHWASIIWRNKWMDTSKREPLFLSLLTRYTWIPLDIICNYILKIFFFWWVEQYNSLSLFLELMILLWKLYTLSFPSHFRFLKWYFSRFPKIHFLWIDDFHSRTDFVLCQSQYTFDLCSGCFLKLQRITAGWKNDSWQTDFPTRQPKVMDC